MSEAVLSELAAAVDGLLYPSETDAPFDVVRWPGDGTPIEIGRLRELSGHASGSPAEVISLDRLFEDLVTPQPWHGEAEKATLARYANLREAICRNLSDVRVFRIGEVRVDIYIIGVTAEGDWVGVRTMAVET